MYVLTPAETNRLLAAIDPRDVFADRDRSLLVLALNSGLRVSELSGLDVQHVACDGVVRQTLYLPAALAKYASSRIIPINEMAHQAITQLLAFNKKRGFSVAPTAPLFVTRKHQRVSVRLIQRLVESLRNRAGLDVPASPHALRHAFASRVAQATGNIRIVQQVIGHKNLQSVAIYVHPTRDDLAQAVAAIVTEGWCQAS